MQKTICNKILEYIWSKNNIKIKLCFISSILMLIVAKIVNVFVPMMFKIIVDSLNEGNLNFAIYMIVLYGFVRILSQFFSECKEIFFVIVEQNSIQKISTDVFHHLHSLSTSFYLTKRISDLYSAIERGIKSIETILKFSSFNIIPTFFEIIFVCIILLQTYNFFYTMIIFITLVVYIVYTIFITQWRTKYIKSTKAIDGDASSKIVDSIVNYETVKYFNNESFEEKNYSKLTQIYKQFAIKGKTSLSILNMGQALIIALGMIFVCLLAAHDFLISKVITIGDVILLNTYLLQLYQPLSNLGFSYREVSLAAIESKNIFNIMNEIPEIQNIKNPKFLNNCHGKIEFKNISFGYESSREILHNISFTVEHGEKVAIVGKSGFGKSTIPKLLFRLYNPTEGLITIDGENIANLDISNLRSLIGIVQQDTVLFHDTIYYNIAYGNPDKASIDHVKIVAKLASIDQFIKSLPYGYETIVGTRGLKLSGGEKQRISIARVLLKQPKIFIFDEATSSLDINTEREIQQSINNASKGHTTIIITHRLSTIKDVNKIIVLDCGKIAETGTHNQLMKNDSGLYYQMYHQQEKELNNII